MKIPNRRESAANSVDLRILRKHMKNHRPRKNMAGKNNPNFVDGEGEQYSRLRIGDKKVRTSHAAWRLKTKKMIPVGANIHHKDENKRNDKPGNLKLIRADAHGKLNLRQYNEKQ